MLPSNAHGGVTKRADDPSAAGWRLALMSLNADVGYKDPSAGPVGWRTVYQKGPGEALGFAGLVSGRGSPPVPSSTSLTPRPHAVETPSPSSEDSWGQLHVQGAGRGPGSSSR